jgi:hypothetical protein
MMDSDNGLFHLTRSGWSRRDVEPFPPGRLETWQYESEKPSDAAKQQIHLVRLWSSAGTSAQERAQLRAKFGYPVTIAQDRHITIDCRG